MNKKKCKGINRAKGFNGCGKESNYRKFGLCPSCLSDWMFGTDDGKIYVERQLLWKVQKPRKDLEKAEKEKKERDKLSTHLAATKTLVHRYVRLRDEGKPCISCGQPYKKNHQAGHFHKAELYEYLKFNLSNINGQCFGCNIHKDGNLEGYNIRLPNRIGKEEFEELRLLAEKEKQLPPKKWTRHELKEIQEEVKRLIRELND